MQIFLGSVDALNDPGKSGAFSVVIQDRGNERAVPVEYVSPYYGAHEGGMFAVPPHKSEVLVLFDSKNKKYFYLGTTVGKSFLNQGTDISLENDVVNQRMAYNSKNMPSMMTFTNLDGAGLQILNHLDNDEKVMLKSVILKSSLGFSLELSDSPQREQASLKNKNQEGIVITGDKSSVHPESSILINTGRNIKVHSSQGEVEISVQDGRDINITNNSTEFNALPPVIPGGNINLLSKNKDINLYCPSVPDPVLGDPGRILISTNHGIIQLRSGPDGITIYTTGDIRLKSENGNIELDAANINMNATNSISLNCRSTLTLASNAAVDVLGPSFGLKTVASTIANANGGGGIWAAGSNATPVEPGPLTNLIPDIGDILN